MTYKKELTELATIPYFSGATLGRALNLAGESLRTYAKRAAQRGDLIRLKRGMYTTKDYLNGENDRSAYEEFLANKLYEPSYLSLAYVLQKYAMISESVFALTSVTTNKTGKIFSKVGTFLYNSVKEDIFDGYETVVRGRYTIRQATKAKALYDYVLFATKSWRKIREESILGLRLNISEMNQSDWDEFESYTKRWGGRKMKSIRRILCSLS
jgi:predicted transcriptional regulator of viral defense system